jgi:hypothetical protein
LVVSYVIALHHCQAPKNSQLSRKWSNRALRFSQLIANTELTLPPDMEKWRD